MDSNQVRDSLQQQQQKFNFGLANNLPTNSNKAVKEMYRKQLDDLVEEKNRHKIQEKQKFTNQRQRYNQKLQASLQSQRQKQLSYKNYYSMVLQSQEDNKNNFQSATYKRDVMKDQFISHALQEQERKKKIWEVQEQKRLTDKRNEYRNGLLSQIEERKRNYSLNKQAQYEKQQQFRRFAKLPDELTRYQREKKKEIMQRYKQDLDRVKADQYSMKNSRSQPKMLKLKDNEHNAIINPLPFNVQNPYILKEMLMQQMKNKPNQIQYNNRQNGEYNGAAGLANQRNKFQLY